MESVVRFLKKLWIFVRRENFERELADEIAFHHEQTRKQMEADGVTPQEAQYAAKRQFGNTTLVREESVETVGFRFETVLQDFRYAVRQLRKNSGFASTAILILALSLGASLAIFASGHPDNERATPSPEGGCRLMQIATCAVGQSCI